MAQIRGSQISGSVASASLAQYAQLAGNASYAANATSAATANTANSASYAVTASYALNTDSQGIFSRNRTRANTTESIHQYDSIFNPSNLLVLSTSIFIVEQDAEYYVLGDLINSGSIVVDGTLKVGGALLSAGPITGIGIIE